MDPTRLELVTSAMRRQHEEFAVVRWCSKTAPNKHIHLKLRSPGFAVVRLGWCQVGVNCDQAFPRTPLPIRRAQRSCVFAVVHLGSCTNRI